MTKTATRPSKQSAEATQEVHEAQEVQATPTPTREGTPVAATTEVTRRDPAALRQRREFLGVSRRVLAELTGLSESRVWASEQPDRDVAAEHLRQIGECLDHVQANGLPEHLRPQHAASTGASGRDKTTRIVTLTRRLHDVTEILGQAQGVKTVKDARELIERALVAARGDDAQAPTEDAEATAEPAQG